MMSSEAIGFEAEEVAKNVDLIFEDVEKIL
jgi:hypothetical protein